MPTWLTWNLVKWIAIAGALALAAWCWQGWNAANAKRDLALQGARLAVEAQNRSEAELVRIRKQQDEDRQLLTRFEDRISSINTAAAQRDVIIRDLRSSTDAEVRDWIDQRVPGAVRRVLDRPAPGDGGAQRPDAPAGPAR